MAVPGALAALDLAQARFGGLPWAEVVAPAAEVARTGFPLGSASGYYLPYVRESSFGWDPETARALRRPDGGWVETGDQMVIDGLAATLSADRRARAPARCTTVSWPRLVAADMTARGGLVTAADLAAYRPVLRAALAGARRRLGAAHQPAARRSAARCWPPC